MLRTDDSNENKYIEGRTFLMKTGEILTVKRTLCVLLALAMALTLLPIAAVPARAAVGVPDTSWYDENTSDDCFNISTADQLAGLAKLVNEGTTTFAGQTVTLAGDISLSAYSSGWKPIGMDGEYFFGGDFDGAGHSITGLNIYESGEDNIGLFGVVFGTIKNLAVIGADVTGRASVGAIVGNLNDGSVIESCYATGSVMGSGDNTGGIVGFFIGGAIRDCRSDVAVSASSSYGVGGVVGRVGTTDPDGGGGDPPDTIRTIEHCCSTGTVTGAGQVGGIVGSVSSDVFRIEYCFSTGTVSGDSSVGGLLGYSSSHSLAVNNSYSTSDVTGLFSGAETLGGIVGCVDLCDSMLLEYCYATGNVTGSKEIGGIVGMTNNVGSPANVKLQNCAALNPAVQGYDAVKDTVGRVLGSAIGFVTTLSSNYAFIDMVCNGFCDNDGAGRGGGDVAQSTVLTADFWTTPGNWLGSAWDTSTNSWIINEGELPKLIEPASALTPDNPTPTYGISLSQTVPYTFTAATYGYAAQTALDVTVGNTGNQPTGALTVALSGTNAGSFELNKTSISSLSFGIDGFTVVPKTGLSTGTYTATVTVTGGANITAQGFSVSFTVNKANQSALSITGLTGPYTYGVAAFPIGTTGGSTGGEVTYSSGNANVVTVNGNIVNFVGIGSFTITATMAGNANYNDVSVTSGSITVNRGTYTGTMTASKNVKAGVADTYTVTLPALPAGASYESPQIYRDDGILDGTLTISNQTTLSFGTLDTSLDGYVAEVEIASTGGTNYNAYPVTVTITAQDNPQESIPTASIEFPIEILTGLVAGEAYTVNSAEKTADTSGNIAIEAGWIGTTINIIKTATGSYSDSDPQSLAIPGRPAAPSGLVATDTTGGSNNGTITGVDGTMEFKLSSASVWTDITGSSVTGLAAGTYNVRYRATMTTFASMSSANLVIANSGGSNPGGQTGGGGGTPPITPTTPETGDNTLTTPSGQPPVTDSDGNTTLPGGGTVETPGGSVIEVPAGTTIDKDGNVTIPPDEEATVTLPGGQGIILPGGSTIDSAGNIITGGGSQVGLPDGKTLDIPPGSTISNDGKLTVGTGGATYSYGGMELNIAEGMEIIFDGDVPLGYFISTSNPYADISDTSWYYDSVMFVYNHGLMIGTSTDPMEFDPNATATRGMIVTILYRMAGSPDVSGLDDPFGDVAGDKWYADAVKWASANGIVSGYGETSASMGRLFGPDDSVTREQLAVMLDNYIGFAGLALPELHEYSGFVDDEDIAEYAREAVEKFFKSGIIEGKPGGVFDPKGDATRAEVAAMLTRLIEAVTE